MAQRCKHSFIHWLLACAGARCSLGSELASESSCNTRAATVALGNTWSHCVNTRLIVQYVDEVSRQVFTIFIIVQLPTSPLTFSEALIK